MFSSAYKIAAVYTRPVITSMRFFDGTVECGSAAFVILNDEGWIITAAHVFDAYFAQQQHAKEISSYRQQLKAIESDETLNTEQKNERVGSLTSNPKWITNHSLWWGIDGISVPQIHLLREGDIALGKLTPFDPKWVKEYPVLKDPTKEMSPGVSLCKLGYPFHRIKGSFDQSNQTFKLEAGAVPPPLFPIEGIFTRNILCGKSKDGRFEIKYLETSSPGLRGQSGGPIFDTKGTLWAVQSRTSHFELGFSPKVTREGREIEEHQFLSVGWGAHPEMIIAFLKDKDVKFTLSDY